MLARNPGVPKRFWDLAMAYVCTTMSFNPSARLNDSPYHHIYGEHIDIEQLHPFWSVCYVYIPLKNRPGKIASPRAYKAHFVGYNFTSIIFPNYLVIEILGKGYGIVRSSKDVIFDSSVNFKENQILPSEEDFRPTTTIPSTPYFETTPLTQRVSTPYGPPSSPEIAPDPLPATSISSKRVTVRPTNSAQD